MLDTYHAAQRMNTLRERQKRRNRQGEGPYWQAETPAYMLDNVESPRSSRVVDMDPYRSMNSALCCAVLVESDDDE